MAEYKFRFLNPRTLALLGEMPEYKSAQWRRRTVEAGEFSITVHKDHIPTAVLPYLQPGDPEDAIFEVRRDKVFEFAGVVDAPHYDAIKQEWTLAGLDNKGFWLSNRVINVDGSDYDTQTGVVAETAMKHYVNDHLVAPSASKRDVNGELDGITFTCEGTHGWGNTVDYNARWQELRGVLTELAHKGNLLHDVVLKPHYTGYEYRVTQPVDATEDGGGTPVIFGIAWENVGEAVYVKNYTSMINAIYVLGQNQGAARTVREVEDATSILAAFRREKVLDARSADNNDKLDMAGEVAISQSLLDALTARMSPLSVGPTQYRSEWDLGYDVTLAFPDIGVTLDRRIEEVWVTLESPEKVQIVLGGSRCPRAIS